MNWTRMLCAALSLGWAMAGCKGEDPAGGAGAEKQAVETGRVEAPPAAAPGGEGPATRPEVPADSPAEASAEAPAKVLPILLETGGLEMVPGSALLVAAVRGAVPLAEAMGWNELRTIRRDWYEMAVAMIVQFAGHNLLDFANLPQIGVDPQAPVGFAWLSLEEEAFAAWIRLTDPEVFKTTLYRLAGAARETLTPEPMGDALILSFRGEDEVKIVLRGAYAFLVASDDGGEPAMAWARKVASIDRAGSMAEVPRVRSLLERLGTGRDAAMYLDTAQVIAAVLGPREETRVEKSWAETELQNARDRGAPPEELAQLTKQAEEDRVWQERHRKRRDAERSLARSLWGSFTAVAAGADLGPRAVTARAVAAVEGGTMLELFGRAGGAPLITRVVSGKPWFLAGATVDVATCRTLLENLMAMEGASWDELEKEVQENLGLGLARDVLALLDGRVGGYAAGELRPRASEKEAFQDLETGAYVGVRDPDAARTLLEKLAAHPEVAPHVKTVDGGWEIAVPEWRTVHVRVAGAAVVAGTDVPFLDRVAAGGGGDWPASQGNPALTALFEGSTHNAAWMMDMGLMAFMVFATFRNGLPPDPPAEPAEGEPPFSAAWQEKKAALIAERKAVEEARSRLDDEEFQVARSLFSALGISAAAGGPATGGLVLEGGQFFGLEGIPAVAREVATRAFELEALSSRRRTEVWDRQNNLWRLEDELRQIREKDLEEHRRQEEAAGQAAEGAAPATDGAPAPAADVAPPPAADGGPPPATNAAEPPAAHGVER